MVARTDLSLVHTLAVHVEPVRPGANEHSTGTGIGIGHDAKRAVLSVVEISAAAAAAASAPSAASAAAAAAAAAAAGSAAPAAGVLASQRQWQSCSQEKTKEEKRAYARDRGATTSTPLLNPPPPPPPPPPPLREDVRTRKLQCLRLVALNTPSTTKSLSCERPTQ